MNKDVIKALALDLYNNNVKTFSVDGKDIDANDALRKLLLDKCGGELTYRNFRRIENDFYEILEVLVTTGTSEITREVFSEIMDFKDTALGQIPEFRIDNGELFEVSVIANGTDNLYRQRIQENRVRTVPFDLGVAIYDELDSFLLGNIDFNKMIDKVIISFNKKVADLIGSLFAKAYDEINAGELKISGSFKKDDLIELVEKVGSGAVVYGSKLALSKIDGIEGFATDSNDIRNHGYVRKFNGINCVELENAYDIHNKKFMLPNDVLFVIPQGEKILYGGFEGDARIIDEGLGSRLDQQIEFKYMRRLHLGISVASRFGVYKIS